MTNPGGDHQSSDDPLAKASAAPWADQHQTSEFPPVGMDSPYPQAPAASAHSPYPQYPQGPQGPQSPAQHPGYPGYPGQPVVNGEPPKKSGKGILTAVVIILLLVLGLLAAFVGYLLLSSDDSDQSGLHIESGDMPDVTAEPTIGTGGTFSAGALAGIRQQTEESGADHNDPRVPLSGNYTGSFQQEDLSGRTSNTNYPINMTFNSVGGTIEFPTLGCSGTLTLQGFQGDTAMYEEVITAGKRNCVDVGQWWFEVYDETNLGAWYMSPDDRWRVTGSMSPTGN